MFEKIIIRCLRGLAGVVYVCLLSTLLSIPVIFIYQAFKEPVFTLEKTEILNCSQDDARLSEMGEKADEWKKIDYTITASSGRFSPYYYKISEFTPTESSPLYAQSGFFLVLDEPLYFTNTISDSFVISVYIKDGSGIDVASVASSAQFEAVGYEKGFFEFALQYNTSK